MERVEFPGGGWDLTFDETKETNETLCNETNMLELEGMERIGMDMEPFPAKTEYRVAYADTDQMGVVYYANFLVFFERARGDYLRQQGLSYSQLEADGYQLPVIEAHVDYVQPARYEDLLTISSRPEFLTPARVKFHCRVHRGEMLLAHGYTVHVWFSSAKGRPTRMPECLNAAPAFRG